MCGWRLFEWLFFWVLLEWRGQCSDVFCCGWDVQRLCVDMFRVHCAPTWRRRLPRLLVRECMHVFMHVRVCCCCGWQYLGTSRVQLDGWHVERSRCRMFTMCNTADIRCACACVLHGVCMLRRVCTWLLSLLRCLFHSLVLDRRIVAMVWHTTCVHGLRSRPSRPRQLPFLMCGWRLQLRVRRRVPRCRRGHDGIVVVRMFPSQRHMVLSLAGVPAVHAALDPSACYAGLHRGRCSVFV